MSEVIIEKITALEDNLIVRLTSVEDIIREVNLVIRGAEGRTGLVMDVNILREKAIRWEEACKRLETIEAEQKSWNKISNIVVGIFASIITAGVIHFIFG